jgi:thioredoxin reductase (NADPH)
LVIVGAGPAALTAAVYAAREDVSTLIIEKGVIGGLMATIDNIENYPGFPNGVEGLNLSADFQAQAERFGAKIEFGEVQKVDKRDDGTFDIATDAGNFEARAVLVATGCTYRHIGIPNEDRVSYCATCDGAFYRDKRLAVVGGGDSAIQESIYLTRFATHIDIAVRSYVKASGSLKSELKKFVDAGKITVHEGVTPDEVLVKDGQVVGLKGHATDDATDERTYDTDGVFVFAGIIPNTIFLQGSDVKLDDAGHVVTDANLMTDVPGIFAAGDCRSTVEKQVVVAAGEGSTAALKIREYLESIHKSE